LEESVTRQAQYRDACTLAELHRRQRRSIPVPKAKSLGEFPRRGFAFCLADLSGAASRPACAKHAGHYFSLRRLAVAEGIVVVQS
jgi:hypothetical protein